MNILLVFIRGAVRPSLTWIGFVALTVFIARGIAIPDWFQVMVAGMVAYWFAERKNSH